MKTALVNPWLGSLVSFLPIIAFLGVVALCLPRPLRHRKWAGQATCTAA
ncbi:MAG: hypothetical protein ABSD02_03500 [Steroidobacteraceae bacterium]|jgi:transporter family-2 protein